ncbi:hypothetical protein FQN57_005708 [Myotisia sp. PD_48]|nr:hypothetical protein FQN57_005708 [Myotisia sp. PD_48]
MPQLNCRVIFLVSFCSFGAFTSASNLGQLAARDICSDNNLKKCEGSNIPDGFCCHKSLTCLAVDHGTTVICCPEGADCNTIRPITCDLQQQDVSRYLDGSIKTTRLTDELPECGNACCPHGYKCQNKNCVVDEQSSTSTSASTSTSTSKSSSSFSTTTTSTPTTTTSLPTNTASMTATSSLSSSTSLNQSASPHPLPSEPKCNKFPAGAIALGFFSGFFIATLLAILFLCWRRRNSERERFTPSSAGSAHGHQRSISISDPMPASQDSIRTDFLRHRDPDYHGTKPMGNTEKVRNFFAPKESNDQSWPTTPTIPQTQIYPRPTSHTENVKMYNPSAHDEIDKHLRPIIQLNSERPPTTFSVLMDRAGFQNGQGQPCYPITTTPPSQIRPSMRQI